MAVVSVTGGMLRRALAAAVLILGLVAMHHLVATGCATVLGGHDHASIASASVDSSFGDHLMSGAFASTESEPMTTTEPMTAAGHESHSETAAPLGGAASLCLAVVVLILVLRRPVTWVTGGLRHRYRMRSMAMRPRSLLEQPPDRNVLSVSRT